MAVSWFYDQDGIWQALRNTVQHLRTYDDIVAIPSGNGTIAAILPWRAVQLFAEPSGDAKKAKGFIQGAKTVLNGSHWESERLSGQLREADLAALGYGWHDTVDRVSKGNAVTFKYCQVPVGLIVPVIALSSVAKFPACDTANDKALRDIAFRATDLDDYMAAHAGLSRPGRGNGRTYSLQPS